MLNSIKQMKTASKHFNRTSATLLILGSLILLGCSATNPAVANLHSESLDLHKQKVALEKKYLTTLGHLHKFPNERLLRVQQGKLKKELSLLKSKINENRNQLDLAIKQWEDSVSEKRKEELFIKKQESRSGTGSSRKRRRRLRR